MLEHHFDICQYKYTSLSKLQSSMCCIHVLVSPRWRIKMADTGAALIVSSNLFLVFCLLAPIQSIWLKLVPRGGGAPERHENWKQPLHHFPLLSTFSTQLKTHRYRYIFTSLELEKYYVILYYGLGVVDFKVRYLLSICYLQYYFANFQTYNFHQSIVSIDISEHFFRDCLLMPWSWFSSKTT